MSDLDQSVADAFHKWYAEKLALSTTYLGVPTMKCVFDLWNYQDIIFKLRPSLIIEFGTALGGSALWFAHLMSVVRPDGLVFTVDILDETYPIVREHPMIWRHIGDSLSSMVKAQLESLRATHPGSIFAILDSDHRKPHVLSEMEVLRDVLTIGDYLVVEDGNVNGHPIYANWGEGPFEAIADYEAKYPGDYEHDYGTERRFGFTFAVNGYLKRIK